MRQADLLVGQFGECPPRPTPGYTGCQTTPHHIMACTRPLEDAEHILPHVAVLAEVPCLREQTWHVCVCAMPEGTDVACVRVCHA